MQAAGLPFSFMDASRPAELLALAYKSMPEGEGWREKLREQAVVQRRYG